MGGFLGRTRLTRLEQKAWDGFCRSPGELVDAETVARWMYGDFLPKSWKTSVHRVCRSLCLKSQAGGWVLEKESGVGRGKKASYRLSFTAPL